MRERAIEQALASVQAKNSTWTRSDLMKNLAWAMGQEFAHLNPDARQDLLEQMTDQALGVEHGVECLEAPEWPAVPRSLIRDLDGRSVYTRPGVTRYATRGQLTMEQRMCQQAQRTGAPALAREFCAAQLGADADTLDAQLGAKAQDATELTRTGLRMDQAAMIYEGLTSTRRVSVGVGPAGSRQDAHRRRRRQSVGSRRRQSHRADLRAGRQGCAARGRDQGVLQHQPVPAENRLRHADQAGDAVCG